MRQKKCQQTGLVVFVGLTDKLASLMQKMDFFTAMREDFLERSELGLPPAKRIASVSSISQADLTFLKQKLVDQLGAQILPIPLADSDRIAFCFNYSSADNVNRTLRSLITQLAANNRNKMPGQRLFHVRMDDANVI